ncbi:MAG: hypothetical protein AB7R89_03540 [Dehalococcoidia bacterium]
MVLVNLLADCAANGITLRLTESGFGVDGPGDAVGALLPRIHRHKHDIRSLLQRRGCEQCGQVTVIVTPDGSGWCGEHRLAATALWLAGVQSYPALDLRPIVPFALHQGHQGWLEFARAASGEALVVALRSLEYQEEEVAQHAE